MSSMSARCCISRWPLRHLYDVLYSCSTSSVLGDEDQRKWPLLDRNASLGVLSSGASPFSSVHSSFSSKPESQSLSFTSDTSFSSSCSILVTSSCWKTWTRSSSTENHLVNRLLLVFRVKVRGKHQAVWGLCEDDALYQKVGSHGEQAQKCRKEKDSHNRRLSSLCENMCVSSMYHIIFCYIRSWFTCEVWYISAGLFSLKCERVNELVSELEWCVWGCFWWMNIVWKPTHSLWWSLTVVNWSDFTRKPSESDDAADK